MNDAQLLRYSRQIMLPMVDIKGQQWIIDSSVLIIGMGGLGSPAAMYLAAAGVGRLVVVDFDHVEIHNLQRQIVHSTADVGRPKVESARETLVGLNPEVQIETVDHALEGDELMEAVGSVDVVVDACDNFTSRFALNEACVRTGTPLVSAAAIRMEAQITVFQPALEGSPCYRCLYRDEEEEAERCANTGVLAPLLGIIGSMQALEALKLIVGTGEPLTGRLLLLDALTMEWRTLKLKRDPSCPVCSS